jgi:hypothetical protein
MYRYVSLILSLSFAIVGLMFLFIPGVVVGFFNGLSPALTMAGSPSDGAGFFRILAVGYMYLVAALAFLMYRHPSNKFFPLLLINGKMTTALVSIILYVTGGHYLTYIANAVVDGAIALLLIPFYMHLRMSAS